MDRSPLPSRPSSRLRRRPSPLSSDIDIINRPQVFGWSPSRVGHLKVSSQSSASTWTPTRSVPSSTYSSPSPGAGVRTSSPQRRVTPGQRLNQLQASTQKRAKDAAARLESSQDWKERKSALVELASLGRQALPFTTVVGSRLGDKHPTVRAAAARALGAIGGEPLAMHAPHLAALALKDVRRDVREAANDALQSISSAKPSSVKMVNALVDTTESSYLEAEPNPCQDDLPRNMQPQFWGITVQQLIDLLNELFDETNPDNLVDYCKAHKFTFIGGVCVHVCLNCDCPYGDHKGLQHMPLHDAVGLELQVMQPNMHSVVAREIKPRTKPHGCSLARMLNPEGLAITAFVTHTWEERFDQFVGTLEMALKPEEVVWVCSCALDQNADIKELLDSDDLLRSPFAQALRHAPKLVVTLDEALKVPERSWCAFELEKASQWAIPTFMWPYHMTSFKDLEEKIDALDIRRASATSKVDQERIHKAIQNGIGYDNMNQRLRAFLGDRLRFFEAAVSKHVGQLAALTLDIEEARKQNDKARLAALEAERVGQHRLMQIEMEMKVAQDAGQVAFKVDHVRIRQAEEEHLQQRHRQKVLERALEEAQLEKDQATQAALVARAQAQDLTQELQQAQGDCRGSSLASALRLVQKRTFVTSWPLVMAPAQAVVVHAENGGKSTKVAGVYRPLWGCSQVYHVSQAVTISRFE
mmetsp:Transcript_54526/g.137644  ORF Transcript_54526/g.137644 Transcript_54526/m.137644 type:complete len:699 (+) Transcript_54526:115-2211(+)|eukprot:CAMPEP_0115234340 /NCGR_PEP_ID=MMETSP0270-20121206/34743_1 /TAXON_ID=71861 /ORGANISM="Scrippsiella trochoidea, Strain CCMP3099" /LENGTH=698 /DNA_ID=CAMNT_0002649085 /DNA_START=82 /DNA_END=2178 /DNA_ORIENTATION=+